MQKGHMILGAAVIAEDDMQNVIKTSRSVCLAWLMAYFAMVMIQIYIGPTRVRQSLIPCVLKVVLDAICTQVCDQYGPTHFSV